MKVQLNHDSITLETTKPTHKYIANDITKFLFREEIEKVITYSDYVKIKADKETLYKILCAIACEEKVEI